jgi:dTDP-4-amino-4,6-dideoxygalactose transaminase
VTGRLIGGLFGLAEVSPEEAAAAAGRPKPAFLDGSPVLTVSARAAIALLLDTIRPVKVWLPSYVCAALFDVVACRARVCWYPVGADLRPADPSWLERVETDDVVVVVDYFGFPAPAELFEEARGRGAFVLEDASQALLTTGVGAQADAVVFSPRKFAGVVDGGVLRVAAADRLPMQPLAAAPDEWWRIALEAAMGRAAYDRGSGDRSWFESFRRAENAVPDRPYAMSGLSADLLNAIDFAEIAERRRSNYQCLQSRLRGRAVLPALSDGVVPLGFPVRLRHRDRVRQALFANDMFAPTHWRIDGLVPPDFTESLSLASAILTLPCDQRCSEDDMDRMAAVVAEEDHS